MPQPGGNQSRLSPAYRASTPSRHSEPTTGMPAPQPSFRRKPESGPPAVIPAQAGIRPLNRHSGASRNPDPQPSFRRKPESGPSTVIPAQAGIRPPNRHSGASRNPDGLSVLRPCAGATALLSLPQWPETVRRSTKPPPAIVVWPGNPAYNTGQIPRPNPTLL